MSTINKVLLRDCRVDVFREGISTECLVRLTHLPTGHTAMAYGPLRHAQKASLAELRRKVLAEGEPQL